MYKFNNEMQNIFLWMFFISMIILPIGWQYKLIIFSIFITLHHLIGSGISDIKDSLNEIIVNQEIYSYSDDEFEKISKEMDAKIKVDELKTKMQKPIKDHIAARLYIRYLWVLIIIAGIFYLSEYPNFKFFLDLFL